MEIFSSTTFEGLRHLTEHKKTPLKFPSKGFFVAEAGLPTLLRMDWRTCKGVLNNRKAFKRLQRYWSFFMP